MGQKLLRYLTSQLAALLQALLFLCMSSGIASAGLYDDTMTQPGTVIPNQVQATYGSSDSGRDPVRSGIDVLVLPHDAPARLRAFRYDPEAVAGEPYVVRRSQYAPSGHHDGSFVDLPLPEQDGAVIPLGVPIMLEETDRVLRGVPVFFVLEDAGLNFDGAVIDSVVIDVSDLGTGDNETLMLFESGPDTGIFTGYICTCDDAGSIDRNGQLLTVAHSRIDAVYQDPWRGERRLEDAVLVGPIDPFGRVFDSRTGAPLNGVEITILDDATGLPATVWGDDLVAIYPSTIRTGSTLTDSGGRSYDLGPGEFRFPFVAPGRYRFEVTGPDGYIAPSTATDADIQSLPDAPYAIVDGSRLEPFHIEPGPAVRIDLPMDGSAIIHVTRIGSSDELEIGDVIRFTVTAESNLVGDLVADIIDRLPPGLKAEQASIEVIGQPDVAAIISDDGRGIIFDDVLLPDGGVATIRYVARVATNARENSTLVSTSTAAAAGFVSNTAKHALEILPAFRRDENIVIGQVFGNGCDARFDPEINLSGIRILMENGRFAETDAEGLFTFRSMPRGTHVLAIDPLSLPSNFSPVLCGNSTRRAGSATSSFVEVEGGLLSQVYFHIEPVVSGPIDQGAAQADQDRDPRAEVVSFSSFDTAWLNSGGQAMGLVYPREGQLPGSRNLQVALTRAPNQFARITLNGEEIAPIHRRPAITSQNGKMVLDTWSGAALADGNNELILEIKDLSGSVIHRETRLIGFNSKISHLSIDETRSVLSSDGRRGARVVLRATGPGGIPLHPGMNVAVSVDRPFAFPARPGIGNTNGAVATSQRTTATVDPDGYFRLDLAPSKQPGTIRFRVSGQDGDITAGAFVASEDRPWMLVGLAESTAARAAVMEHIEPLDAQQIARVGDVEINGRVAFYAQGVIRGKWLATMRYDSAISQQTRDFFAKDPDAQYIVYGDASIEGDAAQSRHPLYLHIEGDRLDMLYGDFTADIGDGLAAYSRRLTGARAVLGGDRTRVVVFAAEAVQSFAEDRFTANGTSGPFDLSASDILPFSERVFVETTARGDIERVVELRELERGHDYSIDYKTGRIFLADPLLGRTPELDHNSLVVQYEIEAGTTGGVIAGGRLEHALSDRARLGLSLVHEDHISGSEGSGQMASVDMEIDINEAWTARLEAAASQQDASDQIASSRRTGAAEVSLRYETDRSSLDLYLRGQDTAFGVDNTSEVSDMIVSMGAEADLELDRTQIPGSEAEDVRRITAEAKIERNLDTGTQTTLGQAIYLQERGAVKRGAGFRLLGRDEIGDEPMDWSGKLVGLSGFETADGRLRLELGQEITLIKHGDTIEADRGALEIEFDATDALTLKATNEVVMDGGVKANIVGLGLEYTAWQGGRFDLGALDASAPETSLVVGYARFDQEFHIGETLTLTGGIERQGLVSGSIADAGPIAEGGLGHDRLGEPYTAFRVGASDIRSGRSIETLAEHRVAQSETSTRLSSKMTRDLSTELRLSAGSSLYWSRGDAGDQEVDHELKASLAFRPRDARYAVLDQVEAHREFDADLSELRVMNSIYAARQLGEKDSLSLRHGLKYARFEFDGDSYDDILNLVGAEYRHDLTEAFDIGLHGAVMHSLASRTTEYSAGLSLGVTPFDNGWLALGYNVAGFKDEDFSRSGYTDKGFFFQFRVKFDARGSR